MRVLSWAQFDQAVAQLAARFADAELTGVYGVPRGGLCLAVALSHAMERPLLSVPNRSALIVDDVYETVNDRNKLIRTLAIAKSAIRHNMAKDLPKMYTPTCIIWGKNDNVTPPEVAVEFDELLPDSELFWIDKCGHAAMMEHPDEFNELLYAWLQKRGF